MPTKTDERRLRDGATAMGQDMPNTIPELEAYVATLHDGIVALQSTDDLGSEAANKAAWEDMLELQRRHEAARMRLVDLRKAAPPPGKTYEVLKVDAPTASGRIYPRALIERELLKYQHAIAHNRSLGPVGDDGVIRLQEAAFVVRSAHLDGDVVKARIELLATDPGKELRHHLEHMELAPVGMGSVGADGKVGDDYILTGFSVVAKP